MNVSQVTKIVSVCLILAACQGHDKRDADAVGSTSQPGVGLNTKVGRKITQGRWCRPLKTDTNGIMHRDVFQFRRDGTFRLGTYVLNQDATMTKERAERGTWAVIDGQLILMREGRTMRMDYADLVRTQDGAQCLNLTIESDKANATEALCPCEA